MKIKFTLILIVFCLKSFSQDEQEIKLPNFTPPSPEASAITKYGDVAVTEYTGMVSHSIPLYNYKVGNLELPISVNYNGSSVKVNDMPTWVGMNWTLNAGGVITRTVRDIADENAGINRVILSDMDLTNYTFDLTNGTSNAAYLYTLINAVNSKDTEVDIFTISLPNFSGSFYLNENFEAVLIKNDSPVKVELDENFITTKIITVTTADGVKYTFGGAGATEDSELRYIVDGSLQSVNYQGTTAFYLKEIEDPIYGRIYLDYLDYTGFVNFELTKEQSKNSEPFWVTNYGSTDCVLNVPNISTTIKTTTLTNRVYSPKYLSKIYSNLSNEEVVFTSSVQNSSNYKRRLDKITVTNSSNNIKTVDFDYLANSQRFFLEKIEFNRDVLPGNNYTGYKNEVFQFEYNDWLSLPDRFSTAQDQIGNFNGVMDNPNLIPNNPVFNPNNLPGFADRYANFDYASKGVLKKITYPTKGYTEFEYESPKAKRRVTEGVVLLAYRNRQGYSSNMQTKLTDGVPRIDEGVDTDGDGVIDEFSATFGGPFLEDETLSINLTSKAYHSNEFISFDHTQEKVTLRFTDLNSTANPITKVVTFSSQSGPTNEGWVTKNNTYSFNIEAGGAYKIELIINAGEGDQTAVPMEAYVHFEFFSKYIAVDGPGVRVKKVIDYENTGLQSNIKRYFYRPINDLYQTIEQLPNEGMSYKTTNAVVNFIMMNASIPGCSVGGGPLELALGYNTIHSNSIENYFQILGLGVYEKVSISLGGDNFENGGLEKTFFIQENSSQLDIPCLPIYGQSYYEVENPNTTYDGVFKGILQKEKKYVNKNNSLLKAEEVSYEYDLNQLSHVNNLVGNIEYPMLGFAFGTNLENCLSNYYVGQYRVNSYKNELLEKETISYIEPIPLGVEDESIYKKIVTTQTYGYGDLRGLPTTITSSTSESGIQNSIKNVYVNQLSDMVYQNGLTALQLDAVDILNQKNIVSSPILVQQFKNNELLMSKRNIYKNIGTSPNFHKIVPDIIQTKKGDELDIDFEDRVVFLEYDPFGRPTLLSLANGSKTKYFYNSKGSVIMKIENYNAAASSGSGGPLEPGDIETESDVCTFHTQFPESFVTNYIYDAVTNLITSIVDSNCRKTFYEYDVFNRLQYIKDEEGNILQEFDLNYRPN